LGRKVRKCKIKNRTKTYTMKDLVKIVLGYSQTAMMIFLSSLRILLVPERKTIMKMILSITASTTDNFKEKLSIKS